MKHKRIIIIIVSIILLLFLIGVVVFVIQQREQKVPESVHKSVEILSSGISAEKNASFVVWEESGDVMGTEDLAGYELVYDFIVDHKYVCVGDIEYIEKEDGKSYEELTHIRLYELETEEEVEVDLRDIIKQHKGEIPEGYGCDRRISAWNDGEDMYLVLRYGHLGALRDELLLINIETKQSIFRDELPEKYETEGETLTSKTRKSTLQGFFFGKLTGTNLWEINGFGNIEYDPEEKGYDNGTFWLLTMKTEDLPQKNQKLYTLFPDLKEAREREGMQVMIVIDELDDDDFFELFLEDGQEISYEGCVIYAHSSVDGKEHVVNSKEEFDLYYEEVSYEQIMKNEAGETDASEDHLPPYVVEYGLESGKEYYTDDADGYRFDIIAVDDFADNEIITVKINGEENHTCIVPVSDERQTVEITVSDVNGNSQTIVIEDVLVTYRAGSEEEKRFKAIVFGIVGGVVLLAVGGIIIGLQIRKKKKQNG